MYEPSDTGKGAPGQAPLATPNRHQRTEVEAHGSRPVVFPEQTALPLEVTPTRRRAPEPGIEPGWRQGGEAKIEELAEAGVEFDAWTIAQAIGEPTHWRHWGFLFSSARARGVIEPAGAAPSRRPTTHKSLAYRWRGTPGFRREARSA